jgi:hypothetical protein
MQLFESEENLNLKVFKFSEKRNQKKKEEYRKI